MADGLPQRKRPAHPPPVQRHNEPIVVLVTVCTNKRKAVLANPSIHQALRAEWGKANAWRVGTYVIMPDHVHLFAVPGTYPPVAVKRWVAYWKRLVSLACPEFDPLWQRDCWDVQMRSLDLYREKLAYVRRNPVRKALTGQPESWPFAGELHSIRW